MPSKMSEIITAGLILSMLTACAATKPKQNEVIESYGSAPLYASISWGETLSFGAVGNTPEVGELVLNNLTTSPAYNNLNRKLSSERQRVIKLANGLDRKAIFTAYDNYTNNLNEYKTYRGSLVENYYSAFTRVNKIITIDDQSGLYKNDVDFNSIVQVAVNDIKPTISSNFMITSRSGSYSRMKDMVVKRSTINTNNVVNVINSLDTIQSEKDSLNSLVSYYKVIKNNIDTKYNYTLDVADTVPFSRNEMPVPVKVTITSRNYDKPLFPSHTFSDKNISIDLKSGDLKIRNNTDQYIKLLSITTYLDDIVSNYSLKDDQAIELPPHSSSSDIIKYDSLVIKSVLDASQRRNMTLNISKSTQVSFGIAAKYRIGEQNIDKTLYTKQKNYSVYDILKANQLL